MALFLVFLPSLISLYNLCAQHFFNSIFSARVGCFILHVLPKTNLRGFFFNSSITFYICFSNHNWELLKILCSSCGLFLLIFLLYKIEAKLPWAYTYRIGISSWLIGSLIILKHLTIMLYKYFCLKSTFFLKQMELHSFYLELLWHNYSNSFNFYYLIIIFRYISFINHRILYIRFWVLKYLA